MLATRPSQPFRWLGAHVAFLLATTFPAAAGEIEWALFERGCTPDAPPALEIPCGDYGIFQLLQYGTTSSCPPLDSGADDPPPYPQPGNIRWFPHEPPTVTYPIPQSSRSSNSSAFSRSSSPLPHASRSGFMQLPSNPEPDPPAWISVIDFDDSHGASTSWLVDTIAGPAVATVLTALDDPQLDPLGRVSDFHVLAKLCEVAEQVDIEGVDPPRAINMSFGRGLQEGEDGPGPDCDDESAACQIAKVVDHLRARNTVFVAAAGNHQELLFPAVLDAVLDVGMLEIAALIYRGETVPAWETPPSTHGLFPGNGLCLRGWAAPSGSSYSSAMFTGWLSNVLDQHPNLDPLRGGVWSPRWNADLGCFVLTRGRQSFASCNPEIRTLFEGLSGQNSVTCWSGSTYPPEHVPEPGEGGPPPSIPSLTTFSTETRPTPESDPCVPCVGKLVVSDVELSFSESPPLPDGTFLSSVYLRSGIYFHPLLLTPGQLQAMEDGNLVELILSDAAPLIFPGTQPSLWYEMKDDPLADCSVPGDCYWSSTPILLDPK